MINRRQALTGAVALAGGLASTSIARPALAESTRNTLRFVPWANLANPDPIWANSAIAINHGYLVWDTLYGIDDRLVAQPQMCAGHQLSSDELTWTFTLRDGLRFHDGEPVRALDCVASIRRWAAREPLGQAMAALAQEIRALDDKRFSIQLSRPFRQMLFSLGARNCFIMPERIAQTSPFQQIKEFVGSGPFEFIASEWNSGVRAVYIRFAGYQPRQEAASCYAGGKVAHFDRVEWIIQPEPAVAAAALMKGEVDWVESPLFDLVASLKKSPNLVARVTNKYGWLGGLRFNQLQPPFDNVRLRQALLPAITQSDFLDAIVGDQSEYGTAPVGFFPARSTMATSTGLDIFTGKRDLAKARAAIAASGYKGEPIVLLTGSDNLPVHAMGMVTQGLFQQLGLNVQLADTDYATMVARIAKKDPIANGGWSCAALQFAGFGADNPGVSYILRGNGSNSWFGWPTEPKLEDLRQQWLDAPDTATQKSIGEQVQKEAFQTLPYIPVAQWYPPTVYRKDIDGVLEAPSTLFWNVRRS
jgi:peptide/nickel transport system substrate-binding protein